MTLNVTEKISCCNKEKCFESHNDFWGRFPFPVTDMPDNIEDICAVRMKANGHKNEFECCNSVRLFLELIPDKLLHSKTGIRHEYLLTDSDNNRLEVILNEVKQASDFS